MAYVPAYSQQNLADSMAVVLQKNLPDSERANAMLMQAMYHESIDTAKAHDLYRKARAFATEKKLDYFISKTWQFEGFLFNLQGNSEQGIEFLKKALPYVENSDKKNYKLLYIKELTNLSTYYLNTGDTKNALFYQLKSTSTAEKLGTERVTDYMNIANIYHRIDEPDDEKQYAYKALALAQKHQSDVEIFQSYNFIALYYTGTKEYATAKLYADSSRLHYCSFAQVKKATNADLAYNTFQGYYLVIATAFANVDMNDSARLYYDSAYQFAKEHSVQRDYVEPQLRLGYLFLKEKNYPAAEAKLLQALADAKAINNIKAEGSANEFLSRLYYEKNDYKNAYVHFKSFHDINDSITGIEKKKFTKELEIKYETDKKEQELQLQKAVIKEERLWKYILIGSLLAVLLLAFIGRKSYRNKQKLLVKEKELQQQQILQLENEKQLAATQAVLKGQEEERSRLAKDLHDGLGGILSSAKYSFNSMKQNFILSEDNAQAFERSMNMLDESISELRRVAHNMMPETLMKLSLNEALQDYCQQLTQSGILPVTYQSFGMDGQQVENTVKVTVYRIIQELTNNIIKHAAASKAMVQVIAKDKMLGITVEDDGKGFDTTLLETAAGIGYKNTKSRVSFLKGTLDIRSKKGEGTSVYIEIPLQ